MADPRVNSVEEKRIIVDPTKKGFDGREGTYEASIFTASSGETSSSPTKNTQIAGTIVELCKNPSAYDKNFRLYVNITHNELPDRMKSVISKEMFNRLSTKKEGNKLLERNDNKIGFTISELLALASKLTYEHDGNIYYRTDESTKFSANH